MLTLYHYWSSVCSQKVRMCLAEKGLAWQSHHVDIFRFENYEPWYTALNPKAVVPTLDHDGRILIESNVILEYLEDSHPTPALLPKSPADRARVRAIEEVMDTHFEAINWGLSELRWFKRAQGEAAKAIEATAARQLEGFFAWLERQLGEREWFNGETFGWGDLAVVPFLNGSAGHGHAPPQGSRLADWLVRANARPSVVATVAEIAAMPRTSSMTNVADLVEQGLFKREYRDHRLEWMIKSGGVEVVLKGLERDNIRFSPAFR